MNNKGFAITGILYTLFVLFVMILLSILGTISYKKGILEKTIFGIEDEFEVTKVENISTTYTTNAATNTNQAALNGKYEFIINTTTIDAITNTEVPIKLTCSVYLNYGDTIPSKIEESNPSSNFTLMPAECNKNYDILLSGDNTEQNKLILTNVYEFKESE